MKLTHLTKRFTGIACAAALACAVFSGAAFADAVTSAASIADGSVRTVSPDGTVGQHAVGDGTLDAGMEAAGQAVSNGISLLGIDVGAEKATVVNFNCKKTDGIVDFVDFYTGEEGYISRKAGADAAYLGTVKDKNGKTKVKFFMSGVTGLVDPTDVQLITKGAIDINNYEITRAGKLVHYYFTNLKDSDTIDANVLGPAPSYLKVGVEYYSYDGHYFYSKYRTMISDYQNGTREHSLNPTKPYASYYQYLSMKSKTVYSATQLNSYIKAHTSSDSVLRGSGASFIKYQEKYGVNALMALAHAALESGWGESSIAKKKNNLFGIAAYDSDPGKAYSFKTVDECIKYYFKTMMVDSYLNPKHEFCHGTSFGDLASGIFVTYSSDPYEGEKCAYICQMINDELGGKDTGKYAVSYRNYAGKIVSKGSSTIVSTPTTTLTGYYVKVKSRDGLLIRSKASTSSKQIGLLKYGKVKRIVKKNAKKTWGKLSTGGWIKLKYTTRVYKITYKLNKGTNSRKNPKYVKRTTATVKLRSAKRAGYTFKGWYSNKSLTKRVKYIYKGTKSNKTLYAKWAKS